MADAEAAAYKRGRMDAIDESAGNIFCCLLGTILVVIFVSLALTVWDTPGREFEGDERGGIRVHWSHSGDGDPHHSIDWQSSKPGLYKAQSANMPVGQSSTESLVMLRYLLQSISICKNLELIPDSTAWGEEIGCVDLYKSSTQLTDMQAWTDAQVLQHFADPTATVDFVNAQSVSKLLAKTRFRPSVKDQLGTYLFGIVRYGAFAMINGSLNLLPAGSGVQLFTHPGARGQTLTRNGEPYTAVLVTDKSLTDWPAEPMFTTTGSMQGTWFRFQKPLTISADDIVPIVVFDSVTGAPLSNHTRLNVALAYNTAAMLRGSQGSSRFPTIVDLANNTLDLEDLDIIPIVYRDNQTVIKETYFIVRASADNPFKIRVELYFLLHDTNRTVQAAQLRTIYRSGTIADPTPMPRISRIIPVAGSVNHPFTYDFAWQSLSEERIIRNFKLLDAIFDVETCSVFINETSADDGTANYQLYSRQEVANARI